MNPLIALGVFLVAIVTDVVWARYTKAVGKDQPTAAMLWALGIVACSAASFGAYLHSLYYFIPTAAGSALGTWVTVHHSKRKESNANEDRQRADVGE